MRRLLGVLLLAGCAVSVDPTPEGLPATPQDSYVAPTLGSGPGGYPCEPTRSYDVQSDGGVVHVVIGGRCPFPMPTSPATDPPGDDPEGTPHLGGAPFLGGGFPRPQPGDPVPGG